MQCLNCGKDSGSYLCDTCRTQDILENIVTAILFYREETCENEALSNFMRQFENPKDARACISDIVDLFDEAQTEFIRCRWYAVIRHPDFEALAVSYLNRHPDQNQRRQWVLYDLLHSYHRKDFIKPRKWCDVIRQTDGLCMEIYEIAAQYYSYVGDYDLADAVAEQMHACVKTGHTLFLDKSRLTEHIERLTADIERYRTKKPYWPASEEARRKLAPIYDEKGITYPRITFRPVKVSESDFHPIAEWEDGRLDDYCAFWCQEVPSFTAPAKDICQIAAVRVRGGAAQQTFQSLIRPWQSSGWKKTLSSIPGLDVEAVAGADDVDIVMRRFFEFVQEDVLVSTDALGNQGKLISRAARYTGMREIKNLFLDLLDYAAELSDAFDMENNHRSYLLRQFGLTDGTSAAERANVNMQLYTALKQWEDDHGTDA